MKTQQAAAIKESARVTPGYDLAAVERRFLASLRVDGIDAIFPGPDKIPAPEDPKVKLQGMKLQEKQLELEHAKQQFIITMMEERRVNDANILLMQAQADKALADAEGVEAGHKIAAFDASIGALKSHNDSISKRIESLLKGMESGEGDKSGGTKRVANPLGDAGLQVEAPGGPSGLDGAMGAGQLQ